MFSHISQIKGLVLVWHFVWADEKLLSFKSRQRGVGGGIVYGGQQEILFSVSSLSWDRWRKELGKMKWRYLKYLPALESCHLPQKWSGNHLIYSFLTSVVLPPTLAYHHLRTLITLYFEGIKKAVCGMFCFIEAIYFHGIKKALVWLNILCGKKPWRMQKFPHIVYICSIVDMHDFKHCLKVLPWFTRTLSCVNAPMVIIEGCFTFYQHVVSHLSDISCGALMLYQA